MHDIMGLAVVLNKILGENRNKIRFVVKGSIRDRRYWCWLRKLQTKFNADNVEFITTFLNYGDLVALYRNSHVFLLPTYAEALGLVVLEALSQRVPVIAYKTGSVADTVVDGVNGYLTEQGRRSELAKLLLELMIDKEKYISLCTRTYESFSHYRQEKISFEEAVEKVLKDVHG